MRRIKHIHFVGIGGAGMGGIAEVLYNQGYKITGSDVSSNLMVNHLKNLGVEIIDGHKSENIKGADVVVVTSALSSENPEWMAAISNGVPVVKRAEMLAELMRFGQGVAVAGTHGKTTTTSILASIMAAANLDPTFVIGGKLNSIDGNAKLGEGNYFIAEADESDASFLHLTPVIAVVTNIARDHLSTYGGDFQNLTKVFVDFLLRLPFYGMAVINTDDPVARNIIPKVRCQVVTYGQSSNADYQLLDYKQNGGKGEFKLYQKSLDKHFEFIINLPGIHNALNSVAAIAVCIEEGLETKYITSALLEFKGIARRFQIYDDVKLDGKKFTLIDDYGHHPQEVSAMLLAISGGWPKRRVVMLYQPHRFTRTRDLFDEFVAILSKIDVLVLLPVYAASELPISGATSEDLFKVINNNSDYISRENSSYLTTGLSEAVSKLKEIVLDDDIVVIQGAGDIGEITQRLIPITTAI